jgi:poly(3-hydroxybutyrate) depolymerase
MKLLHFRKEQDGLALQHHPLQQPQLLIVAPLSGHYATLLRNTVRRLLPELDIYITEWVNARDVPLHDGQLHLDDFTQYCMQAIRHCGPNTHVMAICQPTVPLLMALAVMSAKDEDCVPPSATLIAGPIDTRINPSEVNDYASNRDYEWFENNVIFNVPSGFIGEGQPVYPGFMQLSGFLSLNLSDHITKHYRFYHDLVKNDGDSSEAHRQFYNEYLAVLDMSAPFYLQTIKRVFIDVELPQGKATYRGEPIDLDAIVKTALFTIEGEQDDICGLGQTEAAQHICRNIPNHKRQHYVQPWVGHYGAWNGRHFRETVAPKIIDFIHTHNG